MNQSITGLSAAVLVPLPSVWHDTYNPIMNFCLLDDYYFPVTVRAVMPFPFLLLFFNSPMPEPWRMWQQLFDVFNHCLYFSVTEGRLLTHFFIVFPWIDIGFPMSASFESFFVYIFLQTQYACHQWLILYWGRPCLHYCKYFCVDFFRPVLHGGNSKTVLTEEWNFAVFFKHVCSSLFLVLYSSH